MEEHVQMDEQMDKQMDEQMDETEAIAAIEMHILSFYGVKHQKLKAIEEMAELTQAIIKGDPLHIAEELADVMIMTDQLLIGLGNPSLVETIMKQKLARQIARINESQDSDGVTIPDNVKNALETLFPHVSDENREGSRCNPTDWD